MSRNRRARRFAVAVATAGVLTLLPAAATDAQAGHRHHGHDHGQHHGHHVRHYRSYHPHYSAYGGYYSPIRVHYYRPYVAPATFYLPSPYVVVHGPQIAAGVVLYPESGPVVYAPGYCPTDVHYHPYYPEPGVHGGFSLRVGF